MLHDPYTTSATLRSPAALRCPTALCCPTALRRPPYTRSASTRSTFLRQRLHRPTPCLHSVLVCRPTYAPTLMPRLCPTLRPRPTLCHRPTQCFPSYTPLYMLPPMTTTTTTHCGRLTADSSPFTASTPSSLLPPSLVSRLGAHAAPSARSSAPPPSHSVSSPNRAQRHRARAYIRPAATLVYLLAASIAPPPPPSLPSPPPPRPHSRRCRPPPALVAGSTNLPQYCRHAHPHHHHSAPLPLQSSTPPPCPPPPLPTPYSTHSRRRAHSHRPRLAPRPFAAVLIHAAHDPHRVQRRTFRHPRCRRDHPCGRCRPHPRRR
ncbi:hypothetical protein B0H14DRAFT_2798417 [Mycena olivaceomarginata]|nr:hypothetical protein B0H14DRAFT_2798417 [Mycena olivaceomarginata]